MGSEQSTENNTQPEEVKSVRPLFSNLHIIFLSLNFYFVFKLLCPLRLIKNRKLKETKNTWIN